MRNYLKWIVPLLLPLFLIAAVTPTVLPGKKISQYPNKSTPGSTDLFIIECLSPSTNYNVSFFQLAFAITNGLGGSTVNTNVFATTNYVNDVVTNTVFVAAGSTNVGIVTNITGSKVVFSVYATNDGGVSLTQVTNAITNSVFVVAGSTNVGIGTNYGNGTVTYTVYATNPVVPTLTQITNVVTNGVFVVAGSTNVGIVTNYGIGTVTYTVYATNDGGGGALTSTNIYSLIVTNLYESRTTLTYSGTNMFVDLQASTAFLATLTQDTLIIITNWPVTPLTKTFNIDVVQGGSGGYRVFWDSHVKWPSGQSPVISANLGAWDIISMRVGHQQTNFAAVYQQNFQ